MTLEFPFTNFYDSDFDSRNESNIFDDTHDLLNVAFIDSPGKSMSCIHDDASRSNSGYLGKDEKNWVYTSKRKFMPRFGDLYSEIGSMQFAEIPETTDLSKKNEGKPECVFTSTCLDEFQKSPKEYDWSKFEKQSNPDKESEKTEQTTDLSKNNEEKPECVFTSTCLNEFQKSPKEYDWSKFENQSNRDEESEKTEQIIDLSKNNEDKPECVFASTCLNEFQKSSKEYDWSKFEKQFDRDDESKKTEPKIGVPVSRFDYVPHELSTILEVDSLFMDESVEPLMNSDKHGSLFMQDSKNLKFLKAKDSPESFHKPKASPNFPANVMKVIQNRHIEKFLQEPGILEESDLTLISTDFDSTCKFSEKSTEQGYCHSYYKIKRFNDEESPSLMSFLQHELSCMKDCEDE